MAKAVMQSMTNCPSCGKGMEDGYLGVESNEFTPPAWYRKKTLLKIDGEKLASRWEGFHYFDAWRCRDCRMVLITY